MKAHKTKIGIRSEGFSLVELMIAMVVGLLLLAGVLQILLGNRESFDAQRAKAHIQENARLASFLLENTLAHAGFRTDLNASDKGLFPAANESGTPKYQSGAFVAGLASTGSDRVRVRFQAEGGVHNSRGKEIGGPGSPETTDFEFYVNDDDTLICHVFGGDAQPIVENVDRFEVRYGLDTDDATAGVDRYVSDISASSIDTTRIRSIRIQLLLRSAADENVLPTETTQTFTLSDRSSEDYTDRLGRVLLDQTIALRNALK